MHKVRLFLNTKASSQSRAQSQVEMVRKKLFRSKIDAITPTSIDSFNYELKRAVADKIDVGVSVGGDGTVNTLIQELGGTDTAFLIVPAGTANDLARELGVIKRMDKAIDLIRSGEPERIDLIEINSFRMVTNGGIGIAADVAETVNSLRNTLPGFKKLMSAFQSKAYAIVLANKLVLSQFKLYNLSVESAEFTGEIRSPLLMINNQPALGGNFKVAPETINNDGLFNVTIFTHTQRSAFLKAVLYILRFSKPDPKDENILSFETQRIQVRSKKPVAFFGDGETCSPDTEFDIRIMPSALKVYGYREAKKSLEKIILDKPLSNEPGGTI